MTLHITPAVASANILAFANEGRLIQGDWHKRSAGRELACLLGSIDPKVRTAADCNADLMPLWMAEVTIKLFDRLPSADVVPTALRYGALIARWHTLDATAWDGVMRAFLVRCIDDALSAARPAACAGVFTLNGFRTRFSTSATSALQ